MAARLGGVASMGEALLKACRSGQAREVRRLLSGGADVDDADEQGNIPLLAASANGHVEVVDMLLAAGATVNAAAMATPPSTACHLQGALSSCSISWPLVLTYML